MHPLQFLALPLFALSYICLKTAWKMSRDDSYVPKLFKHSKEAK